ncbi:MAG: hypothetical protein ABEJ98_03795 [Candidatus Nanohaloarchaea archaeon]
MEREEMDDLVLAVDSLEAVATRTLDMMQSTIYREEDYRRKEVDSEVEVPPELQEQLDSENIYYLWNDAENRIQQARSEIQRQGLNDVNRFRKDRMSTEEALRELNRQHLRYGHINGLLNSYGKIFDDIYEIDIQERKEEVAESYPEFRNVRDQIRQLEPGTSD